MEERRQNYDHTSAKDDGEDDDLFWVAIFPWRLLTFEEKTKKKKKKWNAKIDKGGEMARPFPIKTIDLTSVHYLYICLYLGACQLSVYCWPGR